MNVNIFDIFFFLVGTYMTIFTIYYYVYDIYVGMCTWMCVLYISTTQSGIRLTTTIKFKTSMMLTFSYPGWKLQHQTRIIYPPKPIYLHLTATSIRVKNHRYVNVLATFVYTEKNILVFMIEIFYFSLTVRYCKNIKIKGVQFVKDF